MSGEDADPAITSTYTRVVGFCCEKCKAKFDEAPLANVAKAGIEATAVVNKTCPHSGRPVKADMTAVINGATVAFCCEKCVAKAEKDPAGTAKLLEADKPGNAKCPASGKDVDTSVTSTVTATVAFCCDKCKAKFDKDPDAAIGTVE
jgi:YHS domain-containing protein